MQIERLLKEGFQTLPSIYNAQEIAEMQAFIYKQTKGWAFGERNFLNQIPHLIPLLFKAEVKQLIEYLLPGARIIRSLYFDKPPGANWLVNWHQDLTIQVKQKEEHPGFSHWRVLKDRVVVCPPLPYLENILTLRVHLDDCKAENGALRVVSGSHLKGIIRVDQGIEKFKQAEKICEVAAGGIFLMKPLLVHSSKRTENQRNRRVIHVELSNLSLPGNLSWQEARALVH